MNNLNEMQNEIIKEIGNIGAGHVVMYLSKLTRAETEIDITRVYEFNANTFNKILNYLSNKIYAIDFELEPEKSGGFLLVFPYKTEEKVIIPLRSTTIGSLNNIVTAYSKSLEEYLSIKCKLNFKKRYEDIESKILGEVFKPRFVDKNKVLIIDTRYRIESTTMSGHMFLYFNSNEYDTIINTVNKKLQEMMTWAKKN